MKIKINEKYEITNDERNYILNEISMSNGEKTKGEIIKTPKGFYSSLPNVLKAWAAYDLKNSDCTSVNDIISHIENQNKIIEGLLK